MEIEVNSQMKIVDKIIVYKEAGKKIVRGCFNIVFFKKAKGYILVGKNTSITHRNHISCGKRVKFEDYSEIHGLCEEGLIFGNDVTIGRGTMIRPSSYYGKDLGKGLVIGDNSSIGPYGYIGCSGKITIGNNVMIGPRCSFFAENHVFEDKCSTIKSQGVFQKGIIVEDDCWIASNCIILDGVTIGKGSVIGAGTLISKSIPAESIVVDKRNKQIRSR